MYNPCIWKTCCLVSIYLDRYKMPSVRLQNHTVHFACSVRKLYEQMELTDCIVVTRGGLIHCHKVILAVYCPYIKKLLMNDSGITTIDFKQVEHNIMKRILDLMYYGEAEVQDSDVTLFTETAKLLEITAFTWSLILSETFPKRNSILYNTAPTCSVGLRKDKDRNLPVLGNGVIHNQDAHYEREAKSNSCFGNIDLQSIRSPETEERSILKQLLVKVNDDHSKGCIQNSCDIVRDEECSGGEELNPIAFIAVPSLSVKCEDIDDEQTTSCIGDLQLKNTLEDIPHESDTINTVSLMSEQEILSELQIKVENEEKLAIDDARRGHSCSNNVPFITETELSYIMSSASEKDKKLVDSEPMEQILGIPGLNDCFVEGTEDLKVKLESICEISEFNLVGEKSFNTDLDNKSTEDIEPMLLNQNSETENCKDDALSLIDHRQDINQDLDSGCTSKFEMKEARVLLNTHNSLCANNDNNYSAMYETLASTSAQTVFCEERNKLKKKTNESECFSHNDGSVISKKQMDFQLLVQRDLKHQSFKPQFRDSNDLARNMQTHSTKVMKFSCNICCKSFRKVCHLKIHMRTHTRENEFHCKIGKSSFYSKGHLAWHMQTHSGAKPLECPLGNEYYMETHTGLKCVICKKSFSRKENLNIHMRTHTGDRPFECEICKKSFSLKLSLTRHMRTHTGDKPYECEICKRSFSQKGSLNEHMRLHTGDRPFECEICKKSFSKKGGLDRHLGTHSGHRPFECIICKKSFTVIQVLNEHMRTHTGERPYECEICNKAFSKRGNLYRHMGTHTSD